MVADSRPFHLYKNLRAHKTSRPAPVSEWISDREGGGAMTLFTFIKRCLRGEAARTEPDCSKVIQTILREKPPEKEREPWKKRN